MLLKQNAEGERRSGFTLVELLVVIAIIALLLSILMPSLQKAKELAKQVVCSSRQRQLALALMTYTHDFDGWIMPYDTAYTKNTFLPWNSPSDLDPTIKIADHSWYGILWAAKGIDNRDVFFCPSVPPSNNKQYKAKVGVNIEESGNGWILGMRDWAIQDAMLSQWRNDRAPKKLTSMPKPSEFFILADSANPNGLIAVDYKGAQYGQIYVVRDFGRVTFSSTTWKAGLHLRHSDKAGAVFADGHAEFKAMPYWCDLQDKNNWQAKYCMDKPGYVIFDAQVKNQWLWVAGKYVLQPLGAGWGRP